VHFVDCFLGYVIFEMSYMFHLGPHVLVIVLGKKTLFMFKEVIAHLVINYNGLISMKTAISFLIILLPQVDCAIAWFWSLTCVLA